MCILLSCFDQLQQAKTTQRINHSSKQMRITALESAGKRAPVRRQMIGFVFMPSWLIMWREAFNQSKSVEKQNQMSF